MSKLKKWIAALAALAAGTAIITADTKLASEKLCEAEPALCYRLRCINPDIPVKAYKVSGTRDGRDGWDYCHIDDGVTWRYAGSLQECLEPAERGEPYPRAVYAGDDPDRIAAETPAECLESLKQRLDWYQGNPDEMKALRDTLVELGALSGD